MSPTRTLGCVNRAGCRHCWPRPSITIDHPMRYPWPALTAGMRLLWCLHWVDACTTTGDPSVWGWAVRRDQIPTISWRVPAVILARRWLLASEGTASSWSCQGIASLAAPGHGSRRRVEGNKVALVKHLRRSSTSLTNFADVCSLSTKTHMQRLKASPYITRIDQDLAVNDLPLQRMTALQSIELLRLSQAAGASGKCPPFASIAAADIMAEHAFVSWTPELVAQRHDGLLLVASPGLDGFIHSPALLAKHLLNSLL